MEICLSSEQDPKVMQKWESRDPGMLKLNFDGSSLGNPGSSGIGEVLRDELGKVRWAFVGPIGVANSSEVEVRAVHRGIRLLENEDLNKVVVVEEDSLNVIRWLKGSHVHPCQFARFFDEILDRVGEANISFKHFRRSANGDADRLARDGVSREVLEPFDFLPP
ncbi:uncharacterized protein LOC143881241 [Tasmannia lanceolata]|uniref:uncharacterized protein LOC143881241 n=1 Tax=Tasmannia lanceolata TaxID=3420 RepID=UPI004063A0D0